MGFRKIKIGTVELLLCVPDGMAKKIRTLGGLLKSSATDTDSNGAPHTSQVFSKGDGSPEAERIYQRIREIKWWYHSIDLGHGVVTPGGFDHRPYLAHYPIPQDLSGKRVLDVATFDGFWAFELERRGASDVVAIDLDSFDMLDLPPSVRSKRSSGGLDLSRKPGEGFQLCRDILGSKVRREVLSVYDLSPERLGKFDFVFVGDLMLHLQNPMKALQNICSVTQGSAAVVEVYDPALPGKLMEYEGGVSDCVWWRMSYGSLEQIVQDAGFARVECVDKFAVGQSGEKPWLWHAAFRCTSA